MIINLGAILIFTDVVLFGIDENVASFWIVDINCQVYLLHRLYWQSYLPHVLTITRIWQTLPLSCGKQNTTLATSLLQ